VVRTFCTFETSRACHHLGCLRDAQTFALAELRAVSRLTSVGLPGPHAGAAVRRPSAIARYIRQGDTPSSGAACLSFNNSAMAMSAPVNQVLERSTPSERSNAATDPPLQISVPIAPMPHTRNGDHLLHVIHGKDEPLVPHT
jgi:hypothetical protein